MNAMSQRKGIGRRFSLMELLVSWTIGLGILLWVSSLFLPAGTKGEGTEIGIHYFIGSILVTFSPPKTLEKVVVLMSVLAFFLHLLMFVGLAMWLGRFNQQRIVVRCISVFLVAGAVAFKLEEHSLFDTTKV